MQSSPVEARAGVPPAAVSAAVLGPVEARLGEVVVDLGTPKQRALVAALALARGRPVAVDTIVDQLWGQAPPPGVSATLQAYVSQLRRVLEPARERRAPASVLVTVAPGYALRVDAARLDAAAFEATVAGVHRRLQPVTLAGPSPVSHAELTEAMTELDAALALWRGEPYAELGDAPAAVAERARLEELRLVALEGRAVAGLALGHHGTCAAELEALTAAHPLGERLWALRALALARSGRQADALEVLRRVRELLDEELGLEPSAALRELQTAVLRQDRWLEWEPPAEAPPDLVVVPAPRAPTDAVPAPVAPWPLAGREVELDTLRRALTDARAGVPTYVVLTGEPGIGKSRLAAEISAEARAQGVRVLRGRCSQDDGAPPLWPWRTVLDALGTELTTTELEDGGSSFRVWEQVAGAVLEAASRTPLLLVLDDLHWADPSTLRVLRLLVESPADGRLLVVVTWRSHAPTGDAFSDAAEALARRHASWVELTGLPEDATAELFEAVSRRSLTPEQAGMLRTRTEGNPFFLVEYARLAASRRDGDAGRLGEQRPTAVTEVLNRRLERLPEQTRAALRYAAVIGRRFDVPTLAAATGRDEDSILDLMEPAMVAGLVREDGIDQFLFAHALVRDTLREGMPASRLARAHANVARALEGVPGRETEAARHWKAAGPWYAGKAWRAAVTAAEVARALYAYEEASQLLRSALEDLSRDPGSTLRDRYDVLMALIDAYRWSARLPELVACAEEAIDVAKALRDPRLVARAAFSATAYVFWRSAPSGQVNRKVVDALRGTLDRLPEADGYHRYGALLALANELGGSVPMAERRELVLAGLAMAERLGNDRLVLGACLVGNTALHGPGNAEERLGWVDRAVAIAGDLDAERLLVVALTMRTAVLCELGRVEEMWRTMASARRVAERTRIPFGTVVLDEVELPWLAMAGRFEECEKRLEQLRGLASLLSHGTVDEAVFSVELSLRLWQGRAGEVAPAIAALDRQLHYPLQASTAVYLWRAGRRAEARAYFGDHGAPLAHDNEVSLLAWCHAAELALYLREPALAAGAYERLRPHEGRICCVGSGLNVGPVDAYLSFAAAAAGDSDAAAAHADAALRLVDAWGLSAFAEWFRGTRRAFPS